MMGQEKGKPTFILPASSITRQETGILWYEVTVLETESRCLIDAIDGTNNKRVSSSETVMTSKNGIHTVLRIGDNVSIKIEMTVIETNGGEPHVQFRINGYEVDIHSLAKGSGNTLVDFKLHLNEPEIQLSSQWSRLGEPVTTMAKVAVAKSPINTWSCAACVLLAAGESLTAAGCAVTAVKGALPAALAACGGAVVGEAIFVQNCVGACA